MVGIPGKSQGCNTCRRRKVRCDLQRPYCQKCISSARQCEGYERYPVFINRGQQGLERRARLEEARPLPADGTRMLLVPPSGQVDEAQLISSFWEAYAGNRSESALATEPAWLYLSISIPRQSDTLRQALLSLAYVRLGRQHDDEAMLSRGQQVYGQTLRLMQNALYDHQLMREDQTLAAARCMVLYESFESTTGDMAAWQNHVFGIARIIEMRGVHQHRDPLTRSVLESIRYSVMINCLMREESSFLGRLDWLTQPWSDTEKDLNQRLYDYGFALARLMQMSKTLTRQSSEDQIPDMLEQIREGYRGLASLNDELLATQQQYQRRGHESPGGVRVGETNYAITSAQIIALHLSHSIFTAALLQKCDTQSMRAHRDLVAEISRYLTPASRQQLAKQVLGHLEFCLQTRFEYMRPKVIFPLNVVRWELRNSPEHKAQVQALFRAIAFKDHFRIAQGVQNAGRSTLPSVVSESARSEVCEDDTD